MLERWEAPWEDGVRLMSEGSCQIQVEARFSFSLVWGFLEGWMFWDCCVFVFRLLSGASLFLLFFSSSVSSCRVGWGLCIPARWIGFFVQWRVAWYPTIWGWQIEVGRSFQESIEPQRFLFKIKTTMVNASLDKEGSSQKITSLLKTQKKRN